MTGTSLLSSKAQKEAERKARCGRWRSIRYSAKGDTLATIQQVRIHNQTGVNAGCWRKDGK